MNKKPYLITLSDWKEDVAGYIRSLKHINGDVEMLSIEFLEFLRELIPGAVRLLNNEQFPGHVEKYSFIPFDLLDKDRWFMVVDPEYVRFQKRLPDLESKTVKIWASPEGMTFSESRVYAQVFDAIESIDRPSAPVNPYGKGSDSKKDPMVEALDSLLDAKVYSHNCFAMTRDTLKEYVEFVAINKGLFQDHPATPHLLFNLFLSQQPKGSVGIKPDLFVSMYANREKGNVIIERGIVRNTEDEAYAVVDYNGALREESQ